MLSSQLSSSITYVPIHNGSQSAFSSQNFSFILLVPSSFSKLLCPARLSSHEISLFSPLTSPEPLVPSLHLPDSLFRFPPPSPRILMTIYSLSFYNANSCHFCIQIRKLPFLCAWGQQGVIESTRETISLLSLQVPEPRSRMPCSIPQLQLQGKSSSAPGWSMLKVDGIFGEFGCENLRSHYCDFPKACNLATSG